MSRAVKLFLAFAMLLVLAAGAAAQTNTMTGQVLDRQGNPMAGVTVVFKLEEFGNTYEAKTDDQGKFMHAGLRTGVYSFSVKNPAGQLLVEGYRWRLTMSDEPVVIDFREFVRKEDPEATARRQKAEEEATKFENMKAHFDAGMAASNEAKELQNEIRRTPADQRAPMQEKLTQLQQTAITEYQAAEKVAPEKDPNLHVVLYNLGRSYDAVGMYEEASSAFRKATELKPTQAGYYLDWGTSLAKAGKAEEAGAACDRAAATDKSVSATCWRNVAILLQNAGKMKESLPSAKRSTELDPSYAEGWFFLARALVASAEFKQEGEKITTVWQPGTVEAFQRYLELAPDGRFAAEAKGSLAAIEASGAGISTKVKAKKKKS